MSMKIVKLTAENYKRLKAVEITPEGNTVTITGKNGQGKSSILDAIWVALDGGEAGKKNTKPIREGEKSAKITLDLGDLIVTRKWTANDKSYLTVENKDNASFKSPQSILDALVGKLAFDPLAFAGLKAGEQRVALLDCVELDIDLEKNEEGRTTFFQERTEVNREVKRLEGSLASLPTPDKDTPTEEVSSVDLLNKINEAQAIQRNKELIQNNVRDHEDDIKSIHERIKGLKLQLQDWEGSLSKAKVETGSLNAEFRNITVPDIKALQEELGNLEETNSKARKAAEYLDTVKELDGEKQKALRLTTGIEKLDKLKADAIEKAKMPVEGLSFDEDGLVFNGVPFSQASSAEQLEVSVAMAMAINPKLRVLRIQDGSLLDKESMKIIEKMAADKDYQVWIEQVKDASDGVGIYIEDGAIK